MRARSCLCPMVEAASVHSLSTYGALMQARATVESGCGLMRKPRTIPLLSTTHRSLWAACSHTASTNGTLQSNPLGNAQTSDPSWPQCIDHHVNIQWIRGDIMMGFMLVAAILLVTSAPIMAAPNDTFRIRSANVGRDGSVAAVVALPPGVSPKSTDFQLVIDGKPAATAQDIHAEQLNLTFLVDVSGSMKGHPLNDAKSALTSFMKNVRPQDKFSLISFADLDKRRSGFADPPGSFTKALTALEAEGKQTKLYDALYTALTQARKEDSQGRHILVVISDGKDEGSGKTLQDVIDASREALVPIYAVYRGQIEPFADVLSGLANAADGTFSSTKTQQEIEKALADIYDREKQSLAVRFSYSADRGRQAATAVIELRQPDGTTLRDALTVPIPAAVIHESINVPGTVKPSTALPGRSTSAWDTLTFFLRIRPLLWLLLVLLLGSGGGFWLWRHTRQPPPQTPPPEPGQVTKPGQVTTPDTSRKRRETVVIGQYFPIPGSGHPAAILRGVAGPVNGRQYAVEKDIFTIGAGASNDLPIAEDAYVSGKHAYLRYEQGSLFIFDSGSRNGTFVNDGTVPESGLVLHPGDHIKVGSSAFEVAMPSG